MAKIEKKGYDIDLNYLVIHKANKVQGDTVNVSIKKADKVLQIDDREKIFITDVRKIFNKPGSLPTYGIFEENPFNGFHKALNKYMKDKDFLKFSVTAMEYYKSVLKNTTAATGGFLIFAEYNYIPSKDDYLLIFSLNNKEGYNLDEDKLTIEQIKNLDLNKLDLASQINLTKWKKFNESDKGVKTYLSFIKGRKDISKYFLNFIGCADKTTSTESSNKLLNVLRKYLKEKNITADERKLIESEVYDYCDQCMKNKKEIHLSHISSIIDDEYPEEFSLFASSEENGLSPIISGDPKVIKRLKYIKYKSKNRDFVIEFKNELVTKGIIKYDEKKNILRIKDLPKELADQLKK